MAKISAKSQSQLQVEDGYLLALAKQGSPDAYDRLVRRYYSFVRLKASSYFLIGGDSEDLIQEGLVGLYKAIRDYRTDRESSFRNFAELCITRQIITAVKTATRNKHTPLNGYVSFSSTPAGATDSEPTLDEMLAGPSVHDPVNQVISSEELRSLVACLSTVLSELESQVLVALPRRLLLHGDRRAARLRLQDGGQCPPAREAQGRHPSALARRPAVITGACRPGWPSCWASSWRSSSSSPSAARSRRKRQLERTQGRFDEHLAQVNRDLAAAHAAGSRMEARDAGLRRPGGLARRARHGRARREPHARPDRRPPRARTTTRPSTRSTSDGRVERLTLGRRGDEWVNEGIA